VIYKINLFPFLFVLIDTYRNSVLSKLIESDASDEKIKEEVSRTNLKHFLANVSK